MIACALQMFSASSCIRRPEIGSPIPSDESQQQQHHFEGGTVRRQIYTFEDLERLAPECKTERDVRARFGEPTSVEVHDDTTILRYKNADIPEPRPENAEGELVTSFIFVIRDGQVVNWDASMILYNTGMH